MPLINDPDGLSQGGITAVSDAVFQSSSGANTQIASAGGNLPAVTAGDYIEVRDHSTLGNNGLYIVTGSPTTSLIALTKQSLTGSVTNPANASSEAIRTLGTNADEKNIFFDGVNLLFTFLNGFGSVTTLDDDGVRGQALYSFYKEEYRTDDDLISLPVFMESITDERFEFPRWRPVDESQSTISTTNPSNTRQLLRDCGWTEVDENGFIEDLYIGWKTLGSIGASNKPYYFFATQTSSTAATYNGPANEGVRTVERVDLSSAGTIAFATNNTFTRGSGSFVTDGFLVGDYLFVQNAEDTANDGQYLITAVSATTITVSGSPFTLNADDAQVLAAIDRRPLVFTTRVRVFGNTFDNYTSTLLGITSLRNQVYGFPLSEGPDPVITDLASAETSGNVATLLSNITGGATAPYNDMAIGYFASGQSRSGFNAVGGDGGTTNFSTIIEADSGGASGGPPSAEQLYAFVQAQLQLSTNINDPNSRISGEASVTVAGQLAEPLLTLASTGNTLTSVSQTSNPGGGGSGVTVDNFDSNDTNRLSFIDDDGDARAFPFVAAGTINFNANLSSDTAAKYWMFFTNDDAGDNTGRDFGTTNAILVHDNSGTDITGNVPQQAGGSSVAFDFDYDGNTQRGAASAATDVPITIVSLGLQTAQYTVATGTITRATGLNFSLVAPLERNFSNP